MDKKKDEQKKLPEDDKAVFIPMEDIQAIEGVINKMEQAHHEFYKVTESIKNEKRS
jgi:hypothetical protein